MKLKIVWFTIIALVLIRHGGQANGPGAIHAAGSWYAAPSGSDSNDCASSLTPCATINGAVSKASSGDTIYTAAAVYTSTNVIIVTLDKSVTLSGGWNTSFTNQDGLSIIDGMNSYQQGILT